MKLKKYLNVYKLMDLMNVDHAKFNELEKMREDVVLKIGETQAMINYNNQKKWKTNTKAQTNIVILKDNKKYWSKIKEAIDKRIKRGW